MKKLTALVAALLLGGCTMIPTYERPAAPVPNEFPYGPATAGTPPAQLAWQEFFADPQLRQLISAALANNRDLRVAVLNAEQARTQVAVRRADLLPTVNAAASYTRQPAEPEKLYTAGLAVSAWELDLWGRIRSLTAAAGAQYLASEEGRKAAQITLIASVANTWLALVADEELVAITEEAVRTRSESLRLTQLRFDNGVSSEIDFRQAETLYETARATLAQLRRQRAVDLDALALLLGQPVPANLRPPAGTASVLLPDVPAGLPSEVLVARPDVRQAEQQLIAANANIGAARAAFFPRIALTGSAGSASSSLSGLFKGGSWGWTFAPQVAMAIFDSGRNSANLESAKIQRDIAIAQYEKAIQSAFKEVADALAGRANFGEQVDAQRRAVAADTVRLRLAQLRYDNGVASYLDLLDAQRTLFADQQVLVQARVAQLQNQVQLYRALGGGWQQTP
ncbi:efflux transporter outer membrane subunit [Ramlibacter sp. PS4R-6]|uniref:efflux transporter outer membrane subunit n=1 Tax=Ramlibacter sp. PS4R-6 TaxID=3133438 RepID=UPI0030AEE32B